MATKSDKADPKDTTGAAALQKAEDYVKHPRTKLSEATKDREAREKENAEKAEADKAKAAKAKEDARK